MTDDLVELLLESELNMDYGAWASCREAAVEILRLRAENEKLRAALDCFLEQSTPTQWRYSRERAEKLAKNILAAAALKEMGDE